MNCVRAGNPLTIFAGFTNNGILEFNNINAGGQVAMMSVTSGQVVNAPGATITVLAAGGAMRTLDAQLNNFGFGLCGLYSLNSDHDGLLSFGNALYVLRSDC